MLLTRHTTVPAGSHESAPIDLQPSSGLLPVALSVPDTFDAYSDSLPIVVRHIVFYVSNDNLIFEPICVYDSSRDTQDPVKYYVTTASLLMDKMPMRSRFPLDPALFRSAVFLKLVMEDGEDNPVIQTIDQHFGLIVSDRY